MKNIDKYINPQVVNAYHDLIRNPYSIEKISQLKNDLESLPVKDRPRKAKLLATEFIVATGRAYEWTSVIYRYLLGDTDNMLFPPEPCHLYFSTTNLKIISMELIISKYATSKDIMKMWPDIDIGKGYVSWSEEDAIKRIPTIRLIYDFNPKSSDKGLNVTSIGIKLFKETGQREIKAIYGQFKLLAKQIKHERKFKSLTSLEILIWDLYNNPETLEGRKDFFIQESLHECGYKLDEDDIRNRISIIKQKLI